MDKQEAMRELRGFAADVRDGLLSIHPTNLFHPKHPPNWAATIVEAVKTLDKQATEETDDNKELANGLKKLARQLSQGKLKITFGDSIDISALPAPKKTLVLLDELNNSVAPIYLAKAAQRLEQK